MDTEIRENVLQMMRQKDQIEDEIKQLTEILTLNGVGMNDSLVDNDGFPINSIDVYQVRQARHRIICLQNDHKAIMKHIEDGLQGYYSATRNVSTSTQDCNGYNNDCTNGRLNYETPFARVTLVTDGSPGALAGLTPGDEIVEFGTVNSTNFRNITDIGFIVQHSEGSTIRLKIKRNQQFLNIQLTPRQWHGRGLLGCNIDVLK